MASPFTTKAKQTSETRWSGSQKSTLEKRIKINIKLDNYLRARSGLATSREKKSDKENSKPTSKLNSLFKPSYSLTAMESAMNIVTNNFHQKSAFPMKAKIDISQPRRFDAIPLKTAVRAQ